MFLLVGGLVVATTSPAMASAAQPIEERLIASVDGFEVLPEGDPRTGASGPVSEADFRLLTGADTGDVPAMTGYVRVFEPRSGAGRAFVLGAAGRALDGSAVLEGFDAAATARGRRFDLQLDGDHSFGRFTAYEVEQVDGSDVALTAMASGDTVVILGITDPAGGLVRLQDMVRAQVRLTPPTDTSGSDADGSDEDGSAVARAGRVVGGLLVVGIVSGVVAAAVVAWRRRRGRRAPIPR